MQVAGVTTGSHPADICLGNAKWQLPHGGLSRAQAKQSSCIYHSN